MPYARVKVTVGAAGGSGRVRRGHSAEVQRPFSTLPSCIERCIKHLKSRRQLITIVQTACRL
jgi:hypothetical protein